MRRRSDGAGDAGNLLLIEALAIAVLLVVATLYVNPRPAMRDTSVPRGDLDRAVEDVMSFFEAAPDPSGAYPSLLDRMLGEALQGNSTLLQARLAKALPPQAGFNVLLDNGEGQRRLHWSQEPAGEAVSASRLWSPPWHPALVVPGVRLVDSQRGGLEVQAVPVRGALGLAGQAGLRAEVQVELPDGTTANRTAFAPLVNRSAEGPGLAVHLLDSAGAPAYVVQPAAGNRSLFVALEETQGRAAAAGTALEVRLPPGFGAVQADAAVNPGWSPITIAGNSTAGWVVTAKLAASLASASKALQVNATQPAWGALHLVEARADGGDLGRFQGVLVNTSRATASAALPPGRGPWLSVPGLAPWSASAPAGLVVAYPDDAAARELNVTGVRLEAVGGVLLDAAAGTAPAAGWTQEGRWLNWTGRRALGSDEALAFAFTLQARGPTQPGSGGPGGVEVDPRSGWNVTSWTQPEPGVFAARLAGANASASGFNATAGTWKVNVNLTHQGARIAGVVEHVATDNAAIRASASDLQRGLDEGWLRVDTPRVALGGTATVRWSLASAVDELGVAAAQFKCYTSTAGGSAWVADRAACDALPGLAWQFAQEPPAVTLRLLHPSPTAADDAWPLAAEVTGLAEAGTQDVAIPLDSLLGTHAVEVRAEFRLLGPAGAELTQRVSLLGLLDVERPGREAFGAPQYQIVTQAWLPDWT